MGILELALASTASIAAARDIPTPSLRSILRSLSAASLSPSLSLAVSSPRVDPSVLLLRRSRRIVL